MFEVKVPMTSANVACGFDTLGLALQTHSIFHVELNDKLDFVGFEKEFCNEDNLVYIAFKKTLNFLNKNIDELSKEETQKVLENFLLIDDLKYLLEVIKKSKEFEIIIYDKLKDEIEHWLRDIQIKIKTEEKGLSNKPFLILAHGNEFFGSSWMNSDGRIEIGFCRSHLDSNCKSLDHFVHPIPKTMETDNGFFRSYSDEFKFSQLTMLGHC